MITAWKKAMSMQKRAEADRDARSLQIVRVMRDRQRVQDLRGDIQEAVERKKEEQKKKDEQVEEEAKLRGVAGILLRAAASKRVFPSSSSSLPSHKHTVWHMSCDVDFDIDVTF
jgi:hypothetical protein